jgi:general secretion pathway protein J
MKLHRHSAGFTLVELIIALLILSFVMALCASGFRFGTRVWDRVNSQSEQIDTLQAVQGFLRKSISHALIKDSLQEDQADAGESLFIGDATRVKFVSYSPQYGIDDYLYRYELYMNKQDNTLSLVYYPYNLKSEKKDANKPLSMIEGVKNIEIKYFSGFIDENSNESWLVKWDDVYSLPLLVKVNVAFIDNKLEWPEMIIPLRNGPYVIR